MSSGALLSVIVAAYNVAEWLPRCLDSILTQTYENIEIIVIDDGSTDGTQTILDCYAVQDKRIRAIHQQNKGLVAARERGILEAKGEYIGFVDGDDEIVPEMYERLVNNAIRNNAQISQCGIMYCFYDGRRKPVHGTGTLTVYEHMEGCAALLRGTQMEPSLCNKIYHSSIIKDSCLDPSVINNEDMLRNIVLFNRTKRSVIEDFCGYLYWRRPESMSNNHKAVENGRNILKARKLIYGYVPKELKTEAFINYLYGAINTYNSLIGSTEKSADELRAFCRHIIKTGARIKGSLPRDLRLKAFLILHMPLVYETAKLFNGRQRKIRIKRQIKKAYDAGYEREGKT